MLTIFTLPKPFHERTRDPQDNAIESWQRLHPDVQIILFGNEEGIAEAAQRHGVEHESSVVTNEFGTPLLDAAFARARARARNHVMCYVNADIILFPDLIEAVSKIHLPRFLLVGERYDTDLPERVAFDKGWEERLRRRALESGWPHGPTGMDYFVFPRTLELALLPFPVGRAGWDSWLILHARSTGIPVVDVSKAVLVLHQNHDYAHIAGPRAASAQAELAGNRKLVGPDFFPMTIADANWLLDSQGLRRATDVPHLLRRALTYPALSPRLKYSVRIIKWLRDSVILPARTK